MSGVPDSGAEAAIERLAIKAERIARAHAETLARTGRGGAAHWRQPELLWPLSAQGD